MNSDQLRQFRAIAELGNLTKAAEKLYISQPALSMTLTKLEDEIGKLLFVRKGRQMVLTGNGEKLLQYANTVCDAIDQAKEAFRIPEELEKLNLYRIGGVGASLLLQGFYDMPFYRLRLFSIHNYETPEIVGQAIAEFIVADERYMNSAVYRGVEQVLLYKQRLLLCVRRDDPLATREEIPIEELQALTLVGAPGRRGINDWIGDMMRDNRVLIEPPIHCAYSSFQKEADSIPWPFLMSSFGCSEAFKSPAFADRTVIPVRGVYTERSIYLWYDNRIKRMLQPYINLISANAARINQADEQCLRDLCRL